MSCKVAEANAGVHSLAMAVAVSSIFVPRRNTDSLLACDELATLRFVFPELALTEKY